MSEELTDRQTSELQEDLQTLLVELDQLLASASDRTDVVDLDQPIGRLSRMDALQQQSMAKEQRRRFELRRGLVRRALLSFDEDEYGQCRSCEEPVGFRRLKARPETPFCVECMEGFERKR